MQLYCICTWRFTYSEFKIVACALICLSTSIIILIICVRIFSRLSQQTLTPSTQSHCSRSSQLSNSTSKITVECIFSRQWDESMLSIACKSLLDEFPLPGGTPGGMEAYRCSLTISFFFKFYLAIRLQLENIQVRICSDASFCIEPMVSKTLAQYLSI